MMLRFLVCVSGFLVLQSSAFCQLKGDSFEAAQKSKKASLTYTYVETPGYTYVDPNGKVVGVSVDFMKKFEAYVLQKEGIKIKSTLVTKDINDFNGMLLEVKGSQGGVFGIGNIAITDARKKDFNFSPPVQKTFSMIVSHKDLKTLNKIEDFGTAFQGKTAYVTKGTIWEKNIVDLNKKYNANLKLAYGSSINGLVQKVLEDKGSFTVVSFNYYAIALKTGLPVKRHPAGDSEPIPVGVIMSKKNDWQALLTEFVNTGYSISDEFRKSMNKHLGPASLKLYDAMNK